MLYAYAVKFNVIENLKKFLVFGGKALLDKPLQQINQVKSNS